MVTHRLRPTPSRQPRPVTRLNDGRRDGCPCSGKRNSVPNKLRIYLDYSLVREARTHFLICLCEPCRTDSAGTERTWRSSGLPRTTPRIDFTEPHSSLWIEFLVTDDAMFFLSTCLKMCCKCAPQLFLRLKSRSDKDTRLHPDSIICDLVNSAVCWAI